MRITGGKARGINLVSPKGLDVRPSMDSIREAVFSSLGPLVQDAHLLDLFAGTGAYGLEALSRGALSGLFLDKSDQSISLIQQNLKAVAKSAEADPEKFQILKTDVLRTEIPTPEAYDLIFVDPPYEMFRSKNFPLLEKLPKWLSPSENARIIIECPAESKFELEGLSLHRQLGSKKRGPCARIFKRTE